MNRYELNRLRFALELVVNRDLLECCLRFVEEPVVNRDSLECFLFVQEPVVKRYPVLPEVFVPVSEPERNRFLAFG